MKEIITIAVGQCGIQCSNGAWELYCMEHAITPDGSMTDITLLDEEKGYLSFFECCKTNQLVPRALLCDLEATVIDEVRVGYYRNLYHPDNMINGYEDAANNYARGHFTVGKAKVNIIAERLRKLTQNCDMLEGFDLIHSFAGGTGSGLTDLIVQYLNTEYNKRVKVQSAFFPSCKYATAVVEPYNCVLSVNTGIENIDLCVQFDNESCYEICRRQLRITKPTYTNINRLISQVLSSMTCSIRFPNTVDFDLSMLLTNLVPFPRIHHPIPAFSPFFMSEIAEHNVISVVEITRDLFNGQGQLADCDLYSGKFMACSLQYRGCCSPSHVYDALTEAKQRKELRFVEWCPTGFKVGICTQPTLSVPKSELPQLDMSVCCLSNNTQVSVIWERLIKKFNVLFAKRAFVHWYVGEGMEEGEFTEAADGVTSICKDYHECGVGEDGEEDEGPKVMCSSVPVPAAEPPK